MAIIDSRFAQLRLKHLLLLNLIDESRSISKAANALNLTQPAVSIMLKELEAVFRATLVARTRQGAALTNAGKAARDRFYIALNELQAIQNANIKGVAGNHLRSEEHTSELQSLMRISYAVFCLKKQNHRI